MPGEACRAHRRCFDLPQEVPDASQDLELRSDLEHALWRARVRLLERLSDHQEHSCAAELQLWYLHSCKGAAQGAPEDFTAQPEQSASHGESAQE